MLIPTVFLLLVAVALTWWRIRVHRRRREQAQMIVTTYPDIELSRRYGGWDADAYDAHSGRQHFVGVHVSRTALHTGAARRRRSR